ncbi:hypothetical protein SNE40_008794 [Patella caerulea]|uniref:WxxW domain-containing protein n=1 Tax=Patella caerulea TaxID=87958 RepID=A0AAN8PR63_PATCE
MKVVFIVVPFVLMVCCHSAQVANIHPPDEYPLINCNRWTEFFNQDNPNATGDDETLTSLRKGRERRTICANPSTMEYQTVSGDDCINNGELLTYGPNYGLLCLNAQQPDQKCNDYKIRFCCKDRRVRCPKGYQWTSYFDADDPTGTGDWETLKNLRSHYPICQDPIAIDVRVNATGRKYFKTGERVTVSPSYGFVCRNKNQADLCCEDYKVRFCCPCYK